MRLELQRLVARGVAGVARRLIVDVGAVLRHCEEFALRVDPLPALFEATTRSSRDVLWVVAPRAYGPQVSTATSEAACDALRTAGVADVIISREPLGGLLAALGGQNTRLAIVSAGIDERPYELWPLGHLAAQVLDVTTGRLWTRLTAEETCGWMEVLPELRAIVGAERGELGLGGRGAPRHAKKIARVLRQDVDWGASTVHAAVKKLVAGRQPEIAARAAQLRGEGHRDDAARASLAAWLSRRTPATTAYVVARVQRVADRYDLLSARTSIGGESEWAYGEEASTELLTRAVHQCPARWVLPRALDVLGAMVDRGLALPRAAIDPGLVAFVHEPGAPRSLDVLTPEVEIPSRIAHWMRRFDEAMAPPEDVLSVCDVLEDLDTALTGVLQQKDLATLVEDDLGRTLPVLARMERNGGAWVGTPVDYANWDALFTDTERELATYESATAALLRWNVDIYRADNKTLLSGLYNAGERVSDARLSRDLSDRQILERLRFERAPLASAACAVRSIVSKSGAYFWFNQTAKGAERLRGHSVPTTTGRWAMRDLPLQNLPKKGGRGLEIRSGLRAPPGHVLVGADQNAFEIRLLADLSASRTLLRLAECGDDLHGAIAQHLFGTVDARTRRLAKLGMYGALYGQDEDGFRRARVELTQQEAVDLHRKIGSQLADLFAYRDKQLADYEQLGELRTRGGWIIAERRDLSAKKKARSVFNALVQGLGADIQRWVLRELDVALPTFGAWVVHQAHDEIFVAVPEGPDLAAVRDVLVDTMTTQVMRRSGLLLHPVRLVATARVGATWRDLI